MKYNNETISNEEVADILNKSVISLEKIQKGIEKKKNIEKILNNMEEEIKAAQKVMKDIEKELAKEKVSIEDYYQQIKDIHISYTKDRVKIIEDAIRSNLPDDIKTDIDISFGKIDNKEVIENQIYNNETLANTIYLFKSIMKKKTTKSKEEEKYECIGTIKINSTDYENDREYNEIVINLQNEGMEVKNMYDKYKVYPIINILNNSILYKDK
ncbi:hypothetical protein [Paraclostridium bifermentans]